MKGTDLLENIGRSAAPNNCEHIYCWGRHRIVGRDTSGILPVDCCGPSCANRSPESPPFLKRHTYNNINMECSDYIGSDSDFSNTYNIYSKATIYPVLISVHARNVAVDFVPPGAMNLFRSEEAHIILISRGSRMLADTYVCRIVKQGPCEHTLLLLLTSREIHSSSPFHSTPPAAPSLHTPLPTQHHNISLIRATSCRTQNLS